MLNILIYVAIGGGALTLLFFILSFNLLQRGKVRIQEALSAVKVLEQNRRDLLPRLFAVLEDSGNTAQAGEIAVADDELRQAGTTSVQASAERRLQSLLRQAAIAATGHAGLHGILEDMQGVDEKLERARRYYNAVVREHNTRIAGFPIALAAALLNVKSADFFE